MGIWTLVMILLFFVWCGRRTSGMGRRPYWVTDRLRPRGPERSVEFDRIAGLLHDMNTRLGRLEDERDFYRDLLDSEVSFKALREPVDEWPDTQSVMS